MFDLTHETKPLLSVRDLAVTYEGVVSGLRDVSFDVPPGSVVTVLGPNGAGKTTLLRAASGLLDCHGGAITEGTLELDGTPVHRLDPAELVRRGVAHVMEGGRVFADLTVEENLAAGALSRPRAEAAATRRRVLDLFPLLAERADCAAGSLSGGQQQLLAVGRALMARPRLLLLDEPARGLAPAFVEQVRAALAEVHREGAAMVIAGEHDLIPSDVTVAIDDGSARASTPASRPRRASAGAGSDDGDPVLHVEALSLRFGAVTALDGVTLSVGRDEAVAVVGPNGAGKTSFLNCLNGAYAPRTGSIRLDGRELVGLPPAEVAALGVARTFQSPAAFGSFTVLDSILLGRHRLMRTGVVAAGLRTRSARREEAEHRSACIDVAARFGLERWLDRRAGVLPYGVQKRVELARAVASEPVLLLVDEPASGLSASEIDDMAEALRRVPAAMLVVEHDMRLVEDVADRVVMLEAGRVVSAATPASVAT